MNAVVTLLPWLSIGAKGETTALTDNQKLNVPYTEINTFLWVCTLLKAFHIVNIYNLSDCAKAKPNYLMFC